MSDYPKTPEPKPGAEPTKEELREGYVLKPGQVITLDTNVTVGEGSTTRYTYQATDGSALTGRPVAKLTFKDGEHDLAEAVVIDMGVKPGLFLEELNGGHNTSAFTLLVAGYQARTVATEMLEPGQPWGIGREYEGQATLPLSVADRQCLVEIDNNSQLRVEDLVPPHSTTTVQIF